MKKAIFISGKELLFENDEKNKVVNSDRSNNNSTIKNDEACKVEDGNDSSSEQGWQNILMYSMNVLG